MNPQYQSIELQKAMSAATRAVRYPNEPLAGALLSIYQRGGIKSPDEKGRALSEALSKSLEPMNKIARHLRDNPRARRFPELDKAEMAKSQLDVGTLTDLASVTGGQTLGHISLDTKMARGTIRPNSFTLYHALNKSAAAQVVDFWPYASETGGNLPGTATASFSSVGTGTLNTNAGVYDLKTITLKLMVDGRAITTALASQNSYVDVQEQETTNAGLNILSTVDWLCYYGDADKYPNQFNGISKYIPAKNVFDYRDYYTAYGTAKGWSNELALFNLIYQSAGQITTYTNYGQVTHAFMSPTALGSVQGLTVQQLNNLVNEFSAFEGRQPITVNNELVGMKTRFGDISFPLDLLMTARDTPAQAIVRDDGSTPATTTSPTPPASVTAATPAAATGSKFDSDYAGDYVYAVASTDDNMIESNVTYLSQVGTAAATQVTVAAGDGVTLTITPPANTDAHYFRVFRSGKGYNGTDPSKLRYIGDVAANGSTPVTFTDLNTKVPGGEDIFLFDMDEQDNAIDFRMLLPLSRVDLFAQNLFMPWAVTMIGGLRPRIPKFHGRVKNYVPTNPVFDPLSTNV